MSVLSYKTIINTSTGIYKEKGSKFIAVAFPVNTYELFQAQLELIKDEHPKARHHCWAYKMNFDGSAHRLNDDGEPSGTAGKPIMGQLESFGITNAAIVVTRYFGGTKLGASGLIQAYKQSAEMALNENVIVEKQVETILQLQYKDDIYAKVQAAIGGIKSLASEINYISQNDIDIHVSLSNQEQIQKKIYESLTGFSSENYSLENDYWTLTEKE